MEEGFELWKKLAPFERDYFLPRGDATWESALQRPASYADAAAAGRALLGVLRIPGGDPESDRALPKECLDFWTEHSERATLPSALAALGVPKIRRDPLGRWSPDGADTYTRTIRAVATRLQAQVAAVIRSGRGFEDFDEGDLAVELEEWLSRRRGLGAAEARSLANAAVKLFESGSAAL